MFKRFDDGSEEEETTIDPTDLGFLEHTEGGAEALRLVKPLTRRSVKPTRLFQTEEQRKAREAEKAEEEVTDIEEEPSTGIAEHRVSASNLSSSGMPSPRTTAKRHAQTPNGQTLSEIKEGGTGGTGEGESPAVGKVKKPKGASPFDSWKRVKAGVPASIAGSSKGRKRTSSALEDDEQSSVGRRLRNR